MARKDRMSGNEAVAYAIRQVNPDVMPAFPITPSTEIPQMVSTYIANGEMDTEFIPVESEHSSMSATVGAEAGQSFIMQNDAWRDLGKKDKKNLMIHALTSNGTKEGRIDIDKMTFEFGDDRAVGDTEKLTATVYDADGNEDPAEVTFLSRQHRQLPRASGRSA